MRCPVCQSALPTKLIYASEEKKYQCATCTNWIKPTRKSMSKIKLVMGTFSFIAGIPLGAYCSYLLFGTGESGFGIYFLLLGTAAILLIVSLYTKANIRFTLC